MTAVLYDGFQKRIPIVSFVSRGGGLLFLVPDESSLMNRDADAIWEWIRRLPQDTLQELLRK